MVDYNSPLTIGKSSIDEYLEKRIMFFKYFSQREIMELRKRKSKAFPEPLEEYKQKIDGVFFQSTQNSTTLDGRIGNIDFIAPMGYCPGEKDEVIDFIRTLSDNGNYQKRNPINFDNSWLLIRHGICPESLEHIGNREKDNIPIFMGKLDQNISGMTALCDGHGNLFNKYFHVLKREGFQVYEAPVS